VDLFGQDIKLGDDGRTAVAANGELLLTDGPRTGVQDIRLRLMTPLGELFYDSEVGSVILQWIGDENTASNRISFEAEVEQRIEEDPRVTLGSVSCKVISWDEKGLTARATFEFITENHPYNLVIDYASDKKELVIRDVNPRPGL